MKKILSRLSLIGAVILSNFTFGQKAEAPQFIGNIEGVKEYY